MDDGAQRFGDRKALMFAHKGLFILPPCTNDNLNLMIMVIPKVHISCTSIPR